MPHLHGIAWANPEAANYIMVNGQKVMKEFIKHDGTFNLDDEDFHKFVDRWTTCSLDTGDSKLDTIVRKVQNHEHRDSCKRIIHGQEVCRFDYPKLPSPKTIIAKPLSSEDPDRESKLKKAKIIKNKVKQILTEAFVKDKDLDYSVKQFLKENGIDENEYYEALCISEKGVTIVYRRNVYEAYINVYNPIYMYAWQANMDIQLCTDNYAVVSYVTEYLSKPDVGLTKKLNEAAKETKSWSDKDRMHYFKHLYMTYREISEAEAVYRLFRSLQLKHSDLKVIFVHSGFPKNRSTFLKKLPEEGDDFVEDGDDKKAYKTNGEIFSVVGRSGNFQKTSSVHYKYSQRPEAKILDYVCLAQFATSYEICGKPEKVTFNEQNISDVKSNLIVFNSDPEEKLPKFIKLKDSSYMKARNIPSVIRLHASQRKESYEENYAELLLFCPWRNECKELFPENEAKCKKRHRDEFTTIQANHQAMLPFANMLTELQETLDEMEDEKLNDVNGLLDSAFEQDNIENEILLEPLDTTEVPLEVGEKNLRPDTVKFKPIPKINEYQLKLNVRSLSLEQRIVFELIMEICKGKAMSKSKYCTDVLPKRIIAHGGGGVGKSFLINVIATFGNKILTKSGDQVLRPKILLLGPTGMSASLIGN